MNALNLDTLKYAKRLKAAGVAPEQAEALAEVCESGSAALATRTDFQALRADLNTLHAEMNEQGAVLRAEMHEQGAVLRADLNALRAEMNEQGAALRAEMNEQGAAQRAGLRELELRMDARFTEVNGRFQLLHWMLGLLLGGVTALVLKTFF